MRKTILAFALLSGVGITSLSKAELPPRTLKFVTSCGTVTYSNAAFYESEEEIRDALKLLEEIDCGKKSIDQKEEILPEEVY